MVATFKVERKESSIENAFIKRCKTKLGVPVKIRKMNGQGSMSWPDRMILSSNGFVAFIEFKRPGKEPTESQRNMMGELRNLGFLVAWFDNDQYAFEWLKKEIDKHLNRKIYKR